MQKRNAAIKLRSFLKLIKWATFQCNFTVRGFTSHTLCLLQTSGYKNRQKQNNYNNSNDDRNKHKLEVLSHTTIPYFSFYTPLLNKYSFLYIDSNMVRLSETFKGERVGTKTLSQRWLMFKHRVKERFLKHRPTPKRRPSDKVTSEGRHDSTYVSFYSGKWNCGV